MKIGYGRTSKVEQIAGIEAQDRELRATTPTGLNALAHS